MEICPGVSYEHIDAYEKKRDTDASTMILVDLYSAKPSNNNFCETSFPYTGKGCHRLIG